MTALERFLTYIKFDTTSTEDSTTRPSTPGQLVFARYLAEELKQLGLSDVYINDADGTVFGTIPANTNLSIPTLGFLAHMDTSDAASGANVIPRIIKSYDGGRIYLNDTISMSPKDGFPGLAEVIGEDLIVTDGTTLLGADDKAGIAEIMTMAEKLIASERPHGMIKVAFTSDEEIGAGPDLFDVPRFACDYAYTVDGGPLGELEYENFNAASATVTISGLGVHPGSAKNVMKNACVIATEFQALLPREQSPEFTQDYEGFIHLMELSGDVTSTRMHYILRDHNLDSLRNKEHIMEQAVAYINCKYGSNTATLDMSETYYNMREKIAPHMHLIQVAAKAFQSQGVTPLTVPIRGGTDGARLSYMGLPCPNLSTGGYQFHGIYEFIPVKALETMPEVLLNIVYTYGGGTINV